MYTKSSLVHFAVQGHNDCISIRLLYQEDVFISLIQDNLEGGQSYYTCRQSFVDLHFWVSTSVCTHEPGAQPATSGCGSEIANRIQSFTHGHCTCEMKSSIKFFFSTPMIA